MQKNLCGVNIVNCQKTKRMNGVNAVCLLLATDSPELLMASQSHLQAKLAMNWCVAIPLECVCFWLTTPLEIAATLKIKNKTKKEKDDFYQAMAIDGKKNHQDLLNAFRAFLGEGEESDKKGKNISEKMKQSLEKSADYFADFLNGKNDNLAVLARCIRHMFAHGSFTPNGNNILKADNIALFEELTEILLKKSRVMFDDYLKEILNKEK